MGKKGTWFSAVIRFLTCSSKPVNEGDKKRLKHGPSFIPSFREPSSIEEILGDIDHQHNLFIQPHQPQPQPPPPSSSSPPTITTSPPKIGQTPEPHLSATRIQAAYRGYMARKRVTGLVRLQRVLTSQNVRRQTVNAVKQMQLLVRVQTQIQSGRIQMLESQAHKRQPTNSNSHQSEMGDEYWDDSLITKEEKEARLKRKEEAAIKRERAKAYAYSHQLRKDTPPSAHQTALIPWWWRWLEPQLPYHVTPTQKNHKFAATPSRSTPTRTHKQLDSPTSSNRSSINTSRARKGASLYPKKDDDSLMSCPPFSVPNYMSPTASARAKAKARPASNPKERRVTPSTPGSQSSTRRFSFPFTPNTKSPGSIGHLSMDSSVERKPFNRFV